MSGTSMDGVDCSYIKTDGESLVSIICESTYKYSINYKNKLMNNIILKNNISVIYVINTIGEYTSFHYIDLYQHCFKEILLPDRLISYELKNCN